MKSFDREAFTKTTKLVFVVLLKNSLSTHKESQKFVLSILLFLLYFGLLISKVQAQIVPDSTLPVNSQVTPSGNIRTIDGGTRAGNNLFHSFQEFSVPTGIEAFFNNAGDVQNIFSRVTGKSISNIDGLIRANGTANLFLLNPNGIIFGPNARLNIGGSFLGSTANSIKFGDGIEFSATNPQATPLLSVNVPIGLQYGKNPGEIRIQGKGQNNGLDGVTESFSSELNPLEVSPGKSLTFVGGNVIVEGGILQAPGGRVELGGLAGEGTVEINADDSLSFPEGVVRADVSISKQAGINVIGSGGGSITINAGNLNILGESLLTAGIPENTDSLETSVGDITIDATGGIKISSSRIENKVNSGASGNSGNIDIKTGGNFLGDGARIDNTNLGTGDAGYVSIAALNNINIQNSKVFSDAYGENSGGTAGYVEISGGKSVNISNSTITAESFSYSEPTDNTGGQNKLEPGNIWINSGSIALDNVFLSTTLYGSGVAGNVYITATDNINIGNASTIKSDATNSNNSGGGTAGYVEISGGKSVNISNSTITAESYSDSEPTENTDEQKDFFGTGNIWIDSGSIALDNVTLSTTLYGSGVAGNVYLTATNNINIENGTIFSDAFTGNSGGTAGYVEISGGKSVNIANSTISSDATNSDKSGGGTAGYVYISGEKSVNIANSKITAESYSDSEPTDNTGDQNKLEPGNIWINSGSIALDGVILSTILYGSGVAGNVYLTATDNINIGNGSEISSDAYNAENTSSGGTAGTITIDGSKQVYISNSSINNKSEGNNDDGYGNITIRASEGSLLFDRATVNSTNTGSGYAGDIILNATDRVEINNESKIASDGNFGRIFIGKSGGDNFSPRVVIVNNSKLTTNNKASQAAEDVEIDAGEIYIDAIDRVSLVEDSLLQTSTSRKGNAGVVNLKAEGVISLDSSGIFSTVEKGGTGNSGTITISGRSLSLTNGTQIQTLIRSKEPVTDGQRSAGNIVIQVSKDVSLSGFSTKDFGGGKGFFPSAVFSNVVKGAIGSAGNISISARSIWLNKGTGIVAATQAGEGGSIELKAGSIVVLRNGQITTTAIEAGKGGNITINTDGLVAIENSDIIANAGTGSGGQITINSRSGSLGIKAWTREKLEARIGTNIDDQNIKSLTNNLPSSDVTAISGEPGLDGTVTFNTAVFQVIPLNQQFALPPLVPQACRSTIADGSKFIITGRGGLPLNPIEAIADEAIWIDLRVATEPSTKSAGRTQTQSKVSPSSTTSEIIEAQGWKVNPQGQVVLVADTTTATPQNPNFFLPQECQQQ